MPEPGSDIGATLRETRMRARIDIGEVEMRTKIRAKYLRAIENEEWDLLPGPVYVKSFLRTYGDYLGLDSRLLVDEYKRRYEFPSDAQHRPLSAVKRERERERERASRSRLSLALPSWLLIGVVLLAVVAALYLLGRSNGTSKSTTTTSGSVSTTVRTVTHPRRRPVAPVVPREASVRFRTTGADWVCVEDAAGKALIPGVVYQAGKEIPTVRSKELLVNLGNPNIAVNVNGKPYPLPAGATSIGLKITPHGAAPLAHRPTCGQ